jgi:hypothetical protein
MSAAAGDVLRRAILALAILVIPRLALCQATPVDWIALAADNSRFVLSDSGAPFTPLGFNYDRDARFRLLEDYWESEWTTVESDLKEMKALGASVVRIHLQFGRFMDAPDRPHAANLERLRRLVVLAESVGLYLDVTGLGSYRPSDVPRWYSALSESERWDAQARFWEAIAETCADRAGVFAFNLMNEPIVSGEDLPDRAWVHPFAMEGLHYIQYLNLRPAGRSRGDIAMAWTVRMKEAIRKHDRRRLITVGLFPIGASEEAGGFSPKRIATVVDFLAVHLYPEKGRIEEMLQLLARYDTGKPVVIEETFPLRSSLTEFRTFLEGARKVADGILGFYWGLTPEELAARSDAASRLTLGWLQMFQQLARP